MGMVCKKSVRMPVRGQAHGFLGRASKSAGCIVTLHQTAFLADSTPLLGDDCGAFWVQEIHLIYKHGRWAYVVQCRTWPKLLVLNFC